MATQPQIAANQLNAQFSTGPRTPEGKQASSRNALRHGLHASINSLSHNERAQFDEIFNHFAAQYPQPEAEPALHDLALAWFRRERVRTMEAAFFDIQIEHLRQQFPDRNHSQLLALVLMGDGLKQDAIAKLNRWDRAFTRDIDRALKTLKELAETSKPGPERQIAETNPILAPQPALNAPCPCGSGLKYKRCCGSRRRVVVNQPHVSISV
jgi:uncharacterized protein YecA (UPF0149 family)